MSLSAAHQHVLGGVVPGMFAVNLSDGRTTARLDVPQSLVRIALQQPMQDTGEPEAGWLHSCMQSGECRSAALQAWMANAAVVIAAKQGMGEHLASATRMDVLLQFGSTGFTPTCKVFKGYNLLAATPTTMQSGPAYVEGGPSIVRLGASPKRALIELTPEGWRVLAEKHAEVLRRGELRNAALGGNDPAEQTMARIGHLVNAGNDSQALAAAVAWILTHHQNNAGLLDKGGYEFAAMLHRDGPAWTANWSAPERRKAA